MALIIPNSMFCLGLWLEGNPLDKEGLQTTLENLSSDSVLREIGLDEEEVGLSEIQVSLGGPGLGERGIHMSL